MKFLAEIIVGRQNIEERMAKEGYSLSSVVKDKHIECVSRACLMGLSTSTISFASLYLGQKHFTKNIKGMKGSTILISSTFFALMTGYLIIDAKMTECYKTLRRQASQSQN